MTHTPEWHAREAEQWLERSYTDDDGGAYAIARAQVHATLATRPAPTLEDDVAAARRLAAVPAAAFPLPFKTTIIPGRDPQPMAFTMGLAQFAEDDQWYVGQFMGDGKFWFAHQHDEAMTTMFLRWEDITQFVAVDQDAGA